MKNYKSLPEIDLSELDLSSDTSLSFEILNSDSSKYNIDEEKEFMTWSLGLRITLLLISFLLALFEMLP